MPGTVDLGATIKSVDHFTTRIDHRILKSGWKFPEKTSFSLSYYCSFGHGSTYPIFETLGTPIPRIFNGTNQLWPIQNNFIYKIRNRETNLYKFVDVWGHFEFSISKPSGGR